jgi:N-acetylmuramoyl-L-alanine amidase
MAVRRLFFFLCLLLGWSVAVGAPARAPIRRGAAAADAPDSRYTDLAAWGRARGLTTRSPNGTNEIRLSNKAQQIVFKTSSKKVLFDDLDVRLSMPIRKAGNAFLVSTRDVESLLNPLLNPPRHSPRNPIRTVAINAGHGGKDPGNTEGRRQEKHYTLLLAGELRRKLELAGLRVVMVRNTDKFIDLEDRPAAATKAKADLYVSLHFNAFDGAGASEVGGVETYCLTPAGASSTNDTGNHGGGWNPGNRFDHDNIVLGHQVHRAIVQGTDLNDRGLRRARFKELTLLDMPGILVEGGYMTNSQDSGTIYSAEGRTALARAIADGVLAYKRQVERGR